MYNCIIHIIIYQVKKSRDHLKGSLRVKYFSAALLSVTKVTKMAFKV